jgi:hypothetical protein
MMSKQEKKISRDNLNHEETLSGSGAPQLDSRDNLLSRTIQSVAWTTLLAHYPPQKMRDAWQEHQVTPSGVEMFPQNAFSHSKVLQHLYI